MSVGKEIVDWRPHSLSAAHQQENRHAAEQSQHAIATGGLQQAEVPGQAPGDQRGIAALL